MNGGGFDLSSALEQLRPWLLLAFNGGLLTIAAKLYTDNRRLKLAERSRDQDFQLEVNADGRSNLQFVIDNLVRDIKAQRALTDHAHDAHAACEIELENVRINMMGLQRQFINFQMIVGRVIPPGDWSPEIADMMRQLSTLNGGP